MHTLKDGVDLLVKAYHNRKYMLQNKEKQFKELDDFEYSFYAGSIIARNKEGLLVSISKPNRKFSKNSICIYDKNKDLHLATSFFYNSNNKVTYQSGYDIFFDDNSTSDDYFNTSIQEQIDYNFEDIKYSINMLKQIHNYSVITLNKNKYEYEQNRINL